MLVAVLIVRQLYSCIPINWLHRISSAFLLLLNELNIKSSLSLTKFSILLSHRMSMTSPCSHNKHCSHYVIMIKPSSSLSHSSLLPTCYTSSLEPTWYITQNSSSKNYSSPSQRPSFDLAGLTCYTLLSPSITFLLFHSELKT